VPRITTSPQLPFVLLIAGSLLLFLGGLGRLPLFGRDESLYAEAAREMHASGDWITPRVNGGPFFEKPPLYYWMAAASYRLVGVSTSAARLPAALAAVVTVAMTALIGAQVWGRRAGLLAGIALATSLQMAIIGRMGIMDVPLTCLVLLALVCYARWRMRGGFGSAALFGLLIGLGILLKALAGGIPVLVALVHSALYRGGPRRPWVAPALLACACCVVVAAPWFIVMGARGGETYGSTLFLHEHLRRMTHPMQGHGGPVLYYVALIAITFFPWVAFFPAAVRPQSVGTSDDARMWYSLSVVWVLAVLVPFSLISTKLPGYVTPLFPAMSLLVGAELDRQLRAPRRAPWVAVVLGCFVLAAGVALLPRLAARNAAGAGATAALPLLRGPVASWIIAYLVIALGAALALMRRPAAGLVAITAGQMAAVGAVIFGLFPVISPYLEGGREVRLAQLAAEASRAHQIVLYDTRPEAVAFYYEHPVRSFGRDEEPQLLARLRGRWTVLIAPVKERALWEGLGGELVGTVGDHAVVDIRSGPRPEPVPSDMVRPPSVGL
jgi:4-amino-4-deoxy-L-arabinose transferase-like glycosyltransferase